MDRAVGTGARAKLAKAAADNAIWMPVTTCLLFAALKLAQGQPEEIASGLQVCLLLVILGHPYPSYLFMFMFPYSGPPLSLVAFI